MQSNIIIGTLIVALLGALGFGYFAWKRGDAGAVTQSDDIVYEYLLALKEIGSRNPRALTSEELAGFTPCQKGMYSVMVLPADRAVLQTGDKAEVVEWDLNTPKPEIPDQLKNPPKEVKNQIAAQIIKRLKELGIE